MTLPQRRLFQSLFPSICPTSHLYCQSKCRNLLLSLDSPAGANIGQSIASDDDCQGLSGLSCELSSSAEHRSEGLVFIYGILLLRAAERNQGMRVAISQCSTCREPITTVRAVS